MKLCNLEKNMQLVIKLIGMNQDLRIKYQMLPHFLSFVDPRYFKIWKLTHTLTQHSMEIENKFDWRKSI